MRIRSIKPEFWEDERIAALSPLARLLFIASWQLADRNGVFEHREQWIKAKVFPYESGEAPSVSQLLHELFTGGHLVPYEVDGKKYIIVRNFKKHQRISGKEAESNGYYPLPPKDLKKYEATETQLGSNGEAPETAGAGSREQGKEQGKDCAPLPSNDEIASAWNGLGKPFAEIRLTDKRKKSIKERLCNSFWVENWRKALDLVKASSFCSGKNDRGWVADIDWFIRPDTVNKLIEGKYSDRAGSEGNCPFDDAENRALFSLMHGKR
jgi:hypothetical protein